MQALRHLELRLASTASNALALRVSTSGRLHARWSSHPITGMMDNGMAGGLDLPLFLRSANLAPDQRAQVNRILDSNHPAFARLFDQIHEQRQQLDDKLFTPGPVDTAVVERLSQSLAQLQAQLADLELKTMLQIRGLMTPAQLNRIADFHRRLESLHQQMRELMQRSSQSPSRMGNPDPIILRKPADNPPTGE